MTLFGVPLLLIGWCVRPGPSKAWSFKTPESLFCYHTEQSLSLHSQGRRLLCVCRRPSNWSANRPGSPAIWLEAVLHQCPCRGTLWHPPPHTKWLRRITQAHPPATRHALQMCICALTRRLTFTKSVCHKLTGLVIEPDPYKWYTIQFGSTLHFYFIW